jgi:hypothetical protein
VCGMCCVCVRGNLPPSYIGWRQAVTEGIFPSAPSHCPPLHQYYRHKRGGPRRCHGGRGRALGWSPSGLSSRGRLSSAPRASWHGGLGLVLHEVGLLLHFAPLRLLESTFLTLLLFPSLVSIIMIILLV